MNKETRRIKITFEGPGFRYTVFEVKPEDMKDFYNNDRGLMLRNRFREYFREDTLRMARGETSRMIQLCTLVDDPKYPAEVSVTDANRVLTYNLNSITEWRFIVSSVSERRCVANLPEGMPLSHIDRIKNLLAEYIDNTDEKTVEAINNEYITFFNLYTPEGKMLLCMRSRDMVRSEFDVDIPADADVEIDRLCIMCRKAQGIAWETKTERREYDANSMIYDSRWHTGQVTSHRVENVDYFVICSDPMSIDARWFESWAV